MEFSKDKYQLLHLRRSNQIHKQKMENCMGCGFSEKELEVLMDHKLNMSPQYNTVGSQGEHSVLTIV